MVRPLELTQLFLVLNIKMLAWGRTTFKMLSAALNLMKTTLSSSLKKIAKEQNLALLIWKTLSFLVQSTYRIQSRAKTMTKNAMIWQLNSSSSTLASKGQRSRWRNMTRLPVQLHPSCSSLLLPCSLFGAWRRTKDWTSWNKICKLSLQEISQSS